MALLNTTSVPWSWTTLTTLGYTIPELLPPSTTSVTPYTLASPLNCPQGYATFSGVVCEIPNSGFSSIAPSTTYPPLLITLTGAIVQANGGPSTTMVLPGSISGGPASTTLVEGSEVTSYLTATETASLLYCPPPLTHWRGVCATVGGALFATSGTTTGTAAMETSVSVVSAVSTGSAVSTAKTTGGMVVPYKGDASGRAGGAMEGVAAVMVVGAVALWML